MFVEIAELLGGGLAKSDVIAMDTGVPIVSDAMLV
jgi:hypothetical protein